MFWREGSVMQMVRKLMTDKPSLSFAKAKEWVISNTKRNRISSNQPHQGHGEKARRRKQIAAGTLHTN